ncbi:hypothetical protein EU522_01015 [Candidatus Thorarchaeota archaeon]|nr:MAG: hypothetical protein EU522_01015 [Candidatus Thorarchaeota archaeon]
MKGFQPMQKRLQTELYASLATLDQLKKMYDMGVVDIRSFQRESEALVMEVKSSIAELRRTGISITEFLDVERVHEQFPDAIRMLNMDRRQGAPSHHGLTQDEYYDFIGLAILDVATANASKGLMGLADLIVEVVKRLPEIKGVSYSDVIEAVNRVSDHGLIPGIRVLKGGVKVVELRPLELREDQSDVVNLAASKGHVSVEEVMIKLKWSEDHARRVLSSLVDAGMAVADIKFSTGGRYYFPGLRARDSQDGHVAK